MATGIRARGSSKDRIKGKNIAITGGARGLGYVTAAALLRRGARVVIGDRDVAALESAVERLKEEGNVDGHPVDVSSQESFRSFLDAAKAGGPLDVLINNAGVMTIGPFLSVSDHALHSMLEVNLYGVVNGCHLALPDMVARRRGHIVNIASVAGIMPVPGGAVYNASKFGVVGLTQSLADEFAPQGVRISAVLPTFAKTELISGTAAATTTGIMKSVQPEDVAAAVIEVLDKRKVQVAVPGSIGALATLNSAIPVWLRRRVSSVLGIDRVFLDFDASARNAYDTRAQSTIGVIEPDSGS